ncbi:MAG TPA: AMP-binding protein [Burkholderiales bacterium]|nr:AMP-binding protein [Burkholderiales bacterium]
MNIAEILSRQAARTPARDAIIDVHRGAYRRTSFAELDARAAHAARTYAISGLQKGDAMLVFQPMSMELYAALIGAFRAGLVAIFVDPSAGRAQIARCCALYPPQAFLGTPKAHLLRLLVPAVNAIPRKLASGGWVPGARNLWPADTHGVAGAIAPCTPDDPALITFTSGSTGQPKSIVRTHGFLIAQHRVLERTLEYRAGETDLTTLPVFLLANLASGLTSVIPDADLRYPGRIDAARVMRQIDALEPERTAASPAFIERLLDHCEAHGRSLGALRHVFVGGAPVYPRLIERAQRAMKSGRFVAVYGSTEAEPIAHVDAREIDGADLDAMSRGAGLLTGTPVEEIELAVVRNQWGQAIAPQTLAGFEALKLPPGDTGEIVVSGDHVVRGYLHGAGDAETKFDVAGGRWHRTGDLGYLDARGRLWLMGRASAAIHDARGSLHPFAVECAALRSPGIARAALLSHEGLRVLAVEPLDGAAVDLAAVQRELAWAAVDRVIACERIPLDARHNAKIDYPALRAWAAKRLARSASGPRAPD